MKLKLQLNKHHEQEIKNELLSMGVIISDNAELVLTEKSYHNGTLIAKDDSDKVVIPFSEILYIESVGKTVYVHTNTKTYTTNTRIYELENTLPNTAFIRISNSVIIERNSIKRVIPGLSQKFRLTIKNGDSVDVTRTYYYKFKEYYGI